MSNYSEYIETASIKESKGASNDTEMVQELLEAHRLLLIQLNTVIEKASEVKDEETIDLIGAYIRELEKVSWMLDAWNKESSAQLKVAEVH